VISVFPDPYPDELFYSICARLSSRLNYSSCRHLLQDLFGCGSVIASVVFPSHLDHFTAQLPKVSGYTPEYFIEEHTLFPFYAPFLPKEQFHHLWRDICGQNGPATHMRSGIMASQIPLPEYLRFCPQCVKEDKRLVGECYWHRLHQIPGVEICPTHEVYLQKSNVRTRNRKNRHEYISAEYATQDLSQMPTNSPFSLSHQVLLNIAIDTSWLLRKLHISPDVKSLQSKYRSLLTSMDLATYRGRVDRSMLLQRFLDFYSPQFLKLLHCELEEHIHENWLLRLVHTPSGAQHPLFHLLLIRFLGYTAEAFFALEVENKPFGDGPWPCLNPVCEHYCQNKIEDCHITYSQYVQGKPIATFSCTCGFTYSRTGPDRSATDHFKLTKIQAFGQVWEEELRNIWSNETTSLRSISQRLGVDPMTVKRHATRLDLPFQRSARQPHKQSGQLSSSNSRETEVTKGEDQRAKWLAAIQGCPEGGINKVRSKLPAVYAWLYRNDRAWLKEHTPRTDKDTTRSSPNRVNWERRDIHLAQEIERASLHLKSLPERPIQITHAVLGREVGQLALLEQHQDKLPRTAALLKDLVETREAFAIRKIAWLTGVYRSKGIYPEKWQFVKDAGVARLLERAPVKDAIDTALQFLQVELNTKTPNIYNTLQ
jgi:Tn7-like transposition protein D/TniQ